MRKYIILSILSFTFIVIKCRAQIKANPVLTADSLSSGNTKDVLTSFFQLAFDKLTSNEKELKFTSSVFGVVARMDTSLLIDTSYVRYKNLRKLNFAFAVKFDSNYKFNGFASAVKYALIDNRDETVSDAFRKLVVNNRSVEELFTLNNLITAELTKITDPQQRVNLFNEHVQFTNGQKNYGQLDPTLKTIIKQIADSSVGILSLPKSLTNADFNIQTTAAKIYDSLKKGFNDRLLWTIGLTDTTYKNDFTFSNIVINSELLKGMGNEKRKNNVELNIKAALQLQDDTLIKGRDLKRSIFEIEPGFNLVLKTKTTFRSWLEFKISGKYSHNFAHLYKNEERDLSSLIGTLRIRLIADIWVPFEIKYDLKSHNVFGFLNIKANFKALGSIAKNIK